MTAQPHNRFVFCVVVVEFAVNGNQALLKAVENIPNNNKTIHLYHVGRECVH